MAVQPRQAISKTIGSAFDDAQRDLLLEEFAAYQNDMNALNQQRDLYWSRWELETPNPEDNPYISQFSAPYPFQPPPVLGR